VSLSRNLHLAAQVPKRLRPNSSGRSGGGPFERGLGMAIRQVCTTGVTCVTVTCMTLIKVTLKPGDPIVGQVVSAAQKAIRNGEFAPGQAFPSVRALAMDLHIHPNTAHKVVQQLIEERWLMMYPGIGTVVASRGPARTRDGKRLLQQDVQDLVAEAKRLGVTLPEVIRAISGAWIPLETAAGARPG
jgi:GntR family transcriptional regulator